jgi:hypothetical protein
MGERIDLTAIRSAPGTAHRRSIAAFHINLTQQPLFGQEMLPPV